MQPNDRVRLLHMLDAAKEAQRFAAGRSREDLDDDRMRTLSLVKLIEIIGEAANGITAECRNRCPKIPWLDIIGMRHVIVHGYDVVDLDVVWRAAASDLPELLRGLATLIASLEAEHDNGRAGA